MPSAGVDVRPSTGVDVLPSAGVDVLPIMDQHVLRTRVTLPKRLAYAVCIRLGDFLCCWSHNSSLPKSFYRFQIMASARRFLSIFDYDGFSIGSLQRFCRQALSCSLRSFAKESQTKSLWYESVRSSLLCRYFEYIFETHRIGGKTFSQVSFSMHCRFPSVLSCGLIFVLYSPCISLDCGFWQGAPESEM